MTDSATLSTLFLPMLVALGAWVARQMYVQAQQPAYVPIRIDRRHPRQR